MRRVTLLSSRRPCWDARYIPLLPTGEKKGEGEESSPSRAVRSIGSKEGKSAIRYLAFATSFHDLRHTFKQKGEGEGRGEKACVERVANT